MTKVLIYDIIVDHLDHPYPHHFCSLSLPVFKQIKEEILKEQLKSAIDSLDQRQLSTGQFEKTAYIFEHVAGLSASNRSRQGNLVAKNMAEKQLQIRPNLEIPCNNLIE